MYSSIASMVANMLHSINSRESLQMLGKERGSESACDIETRRRTWGRKFTFSTTERTMPRGSIDSLPNAKMEAEGAGSRDWQGMFASVCMPF